MKFIHLLDRKSIERLIALGFLTQEIVDEARRELGVDRKQEAEFRSIIRAQREIERYVSNPATRYSKRMLRRLMEDYPGAPRPKTSVRKVRGKWRQRTQVS